MLIRDRIKEFRRVPAKQLRPSPKNWRTHPKAQRDALMGILSEIGYADALIARELPGGELELIDGHLRAEVTPEQEVPVLVLDVTAPEAEKLLATLDPLSAMAEADPAKLDELIRGMSFDNDALGELLENLAAEAERAVPQAIVEDKAPEPLPVAVSRLGDLWALGEHRLLCGDSTDSACVERVVANSKAALVSTDPPYLVDYTGERPKHGARDSGKDWSATYKEVEIQDAERFFTGVFSNVLRVIAPHAAIYCWHAHRRCGLIQRIWGELGILDHQQIIWVKPASVFGRVFWHFRHEPCMMGWVKGSQPEHAAGNNRSDHQYNSVWEIAWETPGNHTPGNHTPGNHTPGIPAPGISAPGRSSDAATSRSQREAADDMLMEHEPRRTRERDTDGDVDAENGDSDQGVGVGAGPGVGGKARPGNNEHPTQKPVEIFARPMRRHTKRGDLCFEPFSGSGTQIIAAEQLQRRCAAIELEPVFVDVAIRRWQNLTGKRAVLLGVAEASSAGAGTGVPGVEKARGVGAVVGKTWHEVAVERGVDLPVEERAATVRDAGTTPKSSTNKSSTKKSSTKKLTRESTNHADHTDQAERQRSSRRAASARRTGSGGATPKRTQRVSDAFDADTRASRSAGGRGTPGTMPANVPVKVPAALSNASTPSASSPIARNKAKGDLVSTAARVRNQKSAKTKRGR
jgi:DNA modification methylase